MEQGVANKRMGRIGKNTGMPSTDIPASRKKNLNVPSLER